MPPGDVKSDMERVGVFKEMSYISVGDKYAPPINRPFNESAYRSKQMQAGIAKQRCALQNGFFDKSFKRIFEREALSDPLKLARQNRIQQANKNLAKAFLPCNGVKRPCGSGSYYGTLSGPVEAMSPMSVPRTAHRSPGRNVVTSPPKKGSGYSYPNVTLSKIELYASDPYNRAKEELEKETAIHRSKVRDGPFQLNLHPRDYFQGNPYRSDKPRPPSHKPLPAAQRVSAVPFKPSSPSKKIGGMKAGTFDTYPSHSADPYVIRRSKPTNPEPVFRPPPGPKSIPVRSIVTIHVNRFDPCMSFPFSVLTRRAFR
ncbi:cilia-and flagella-associated protein 96 isoform X1 [Sebastes fasciatus]|uniref:cilia-and flagella-associated protein 96 isoform X1 n=1 Tax=Sebastes fasciatus TaxID=394691 RepID=UPI003D9F182D